MSPEMSAKVQLWRQKAREGTLSVEESREALAFLRADRVHAAATSKASSTRKATSAAKKSIDSDSLLDELGGL